MYKRQGIPVVMKVFDALKSKLEDEAAAEPEAFKGIVTDTWQ